MHSKLVWSSLGVNVSCRKVFRDSWPSASGCEAFSFTGGVGKLNVVASGAVEDFGCGGSTSVEQRLPLLRILRGYPFELTGFRIAPSDPETQKIRCSIAPRKVSPASQGADLSQSVLDRWLQANFPGWSARFSASPVPQWLMISILASSLYLYTPTADALGFSTPKVATPEVGGNAGSVSSRYISQNAIQESEAFRARVSLAIDLLERGQNAQAQGEFSKALDLYEEVKQTAGDLALAEYARVGHAVTLYEVGDRSEAITEMEDVSIALRGYPEIHAALAAALYVDKHAPMPAEKQFNIATLLDPRYTNVKWVEENKHWPPSLINSLKRFISLQ